MRRYRWQLALTAVVLVASSALADAASGQSSSVTIMVAESVGLNDTRSALGAASASLSENVLLGEVWQVLPPAVIRVAESAQLGDTYAVAAGATPTPTATSTPTPSAEPTATSTATVTATPTVTRTPTVTPTSTATPTPPPGLHSLAVDGATGFAEAPATSALNLTGDWTVELWFRDEDPNGFDHPYRYLVDKGNGDYAESPYYVLLGNGGLLVGIRTAGVNHPLTYNLHIAGYSPHIWQHVAATFQSSTTTLTLYLNGQRVAQQALSARSTGNTLPLEIGRQGPATAKYWLGKIDDLRVWNIARSATDIAAGFGHEVTTTPPGLVANWKFDEAGGSVAADSVAGDNAALAGGAAFSVDVHP